MPSDLPPDFKKFKQVETVIDKKGTEENSDTYGSEVDFEGGNGDPEKAEKSRIILGALLPFEYPRRLPDNSGYFKMTKDQLSAIVAYGNNLYAKAHISKATIDSERLAVYEGFWKMTPEEQLATVEANASK